MSELIAPALPNSAPTVFKMVDYSDAANPVVTSTVTLNVRDKDFISEDAVYAVERGAAAWHRSNEVLTLGEFEFGVHLFVSQAANTTSGTRPLEEVLISCSRRSDWLGYPFSANYNKKKHTLYPRAFKIEAYNAEGKLVTVFQLHDGLPINDPSLNQGFPTEEKPNRPKFLAGMFLPWWNERPRRSASLEEMYSGITEDGMRPSQAKSHFTFNGCEPSLTGGYSGYSRNSLGNIFVNKEWAMVKGSYWPQEGSSDPYFNYPDTCYDGRSAYMGPWVEGYGYEPGSRTTHNWYTAPGGPRPDRAAFPSQLAMWMTDAYGKRPDGVAFSEIAYGYALAYANHPNHWVTDPTRLSFISDEDAIESRKGFTGNYYGDGRSDGLDSIRVNADQRDGTSDWNLDINGEMVMNGWGRDGLHDYASAAHAAIAFQSPMFMIMSKWDTITAFMCHGNPDWSGRGSDWDSGSYLVRDAAWNTMHHVLAWKVAADHPLGFSRKSIEDRFVRHLEAIHRDILTPIQLGQRPANLKYYLEGIVRFGQPLNKGGSSWECHGGGLAFYIGGVLAYMKQSGMYAALQERGGKAYEALLFNIRNYCQYAFGMFAHTRATMFSNPAYYEKAVFADGTNIPADWTEFGLNCDKPGDFNGPGDGSCWGGDRDVSVHPVIQFIYVMRDFYPEIDHPLKKEAIEKVDMYLKRQTDYVASKPTDQKRDADHIFRYPGVAPMKPPKKVGPGKPVALPVLENIQMEQAPIVISATRIDEPTVPGQWFWVGKEYTKMDVTKGMILRYGMVGVGYNYVVCNADGNVEATNDFFGGDPAYGIAKDIHRFVPDAVVVEPTPEPVVIPEPVVEPTPEPVVVVEEPKVEEPPVVEPEVVVVPEPEVVEPPKVELADALVAGAIAFLQAYGYKVTK